MDDANLDATALAALVRDRQVSPAELVDAAIERIERGNGEINAVVWRSFERARAEARAIGSSADAPFAGVPFLLKDLLAHDAGEPSTSGCGLLRDYRAPADSELVRRYRKAGLVVLGRTNTPEFGIYGVTEPRAFGPTRNPWDLTRTPGGSSGGSAAAVAAGFVPMAHGGDGGGSIRIPASHCGLVGLKPTRARNPAGPLSGERWAGLVSEHVLTRSVRDSAAMLDATMGTDAGAPYEVTAAARPYVDEVAMGAAGQGRRLRIAFWTQPLFGSPAAATHPECQQAIEEAAKLASALGHRVTEACPPYDREDLVQAYFTIVAASVHRAVDQAGELAGRRPKAADFEGPTWMLKLIGGKLSAGEYVAALERVHFAHRRLASFFDAHDVFLTPTVATPPVPIGTFAPTRSQRFLMALLRALPMRPLLLTALRELASTALDATPNTMLFNLTGQPAISLPLHMTPEGLPIGTQWVARFGDEATLFQLAAELEAASPWGARRPPLLATEKVSS
jgi:amidase